MTGYVIEVRGTPAPQGSKRHIGNGRMIEMSKAVGPWREAVRASAVKAVTLPLSGPVQCRVIFYMPRPASHYRANGILKPFAPEFPSVRPDLDKLVRAVLDGLTMGGAWKDDGQVALLSAMKKYTPSDSLPGCVIELKELGAEQ